MWTMWTMWTSIGMTGVFVVQAAVSAPGPDPSQPGPKRIVVGEMAGRAARAWAILSETGTLARQINTLPETPPLRLVKPLQLAV
jgi:hypothetical protein